MTQSITKTKTAQTQTQAHAQQNSKLKTQNSKRRTTAPKSKTFTQRNQLVRIPTCNNARHEIHRCQDFALALFFFCNTSMISPFMAWFGMSILCASSCKKKLETWIQIHDWKKYNCHTRLLFFTTFVFGDVWCSFSQSSIASRSYVWPSAAITGSCIQTYWSTNYLVCY